MEKTNFLNNLGNLYESIPNYQKRRINFWVFFFAFLTTFGYMLLTLISLVGGGEIAIFLMNLAGIGLGNYYNSLILTFLLISIIIFIGPKKFIWHILGLVIGVANNFLMFLFSISLLSIEVVQVTQIVFSVICGVVHIFNYVKEKIKIEKKAKVIRERGVN